VVPFLLKYAHKLEDLIKLVAATDEPLIDDDFVFQVAKRNHTLLVRYILSLENPRWNAMLLMNLKDQSVMNDVALHPATLVTPDQLKQLRPSNLSDFALMALEHRVKNKEMET
jgi:hypothetical protein